MFMSVVDYKTCRKCNIIKPMDQFYRLSSKNSRNTLDGYLNYCKKCHGNLGALYRNKRKNIEKERKRKYHKERKINIFQKYGGAACAVCGEDDETCLQLDHINGGGNKHRAATTGCKKGGSFYCWIKRNNYPPGFQVLCANCNVAKQVTGSYPEYRATPRIKFYTFDEVIKCF